jgi:putative flippase GtrA
MVSPKDKGVMDKMKEKSNQFFTLFMKFWAVFGQFIKFNMVGVVNTVITFTVSFSLIHLFGMHELVTYPIGYVCGLINSFIMNKFWTFGKKHHFGILEIIKFIIVNMIALGGSEVIIKFAGDVFNTAPAVGILLGLCFSIPANYVGFKFWVFKD